MTSNLVRAFTRAGYDKPRRLSRALEWIVEEQKEDGGWHCFDSSKGTLEYWQPLSAFSALPRNRWNRSIKKSVERGAEFYLERQLFREGTRRYAPWFRFHYPAHYYFDLLVGLEVLTSLGYAGDPRMKRALAILRKKRTPEGTWLLDGLHPDLPPDDKESSYSFALPYEPFPDIPFGLEKVGEPSKNITFCALKVLRQVELVADRLGVRFPDSLEH
ncbi:MAG: prenyltransferase/squalene oxidase repeat-containing protein [Nitrososphaerales archaeon]